MEKNYNKLVRDRIPEIINASGKSCTTEILSDEEYLRMLDAKLDEELAEYHKDQNVEELADLLEVIRSAAMAHGYTLEDLERVRAEKAAKRGGFEKRILLKTVIDPAKPDSLVERICQNKEIILECISASMIEKYFWLEEHLNKCNVAANEEYQRKFAHYYRMRFVSKEYRQAFFALFEKVKNQEEVSFEEVARRLYTVDGKHEFSFISKMLHTIDTSKPIFDSQVKAALQINRTYEPDFEKRIQFDIEILNQISVQYQVLLASPQIREIIDEIDRRSNPRKMSIEKKLDFILWGLGGK
jgi:predicted house-cleaning noncanonical NTP pyrophosphatase (MazG superfamily)